MWLKIKQESSGWPAWVQSEEQKQEYIQNYFEKEHVQLNEACIEKNPGKRFIAKIMLNSFWGKLSQRPNMSKSVVCRNYNELWKIVNDDEFVSEGEDMPNDKTIILCYKQKDVEQCNPGNTSVAISSFVTAYARLHLYKWMEMVDTIGHDRLLYFDTDSIIFIRKPEDPEIPTGDYLGDLTDEIKDGYGPDAICTKFVSLGPKNYGLEVTINGQTKATIKTKGIRNDGKTLNLINIQNMLTMVNEFLNGNGHDISIPQWRIISHKFKHYVKSEDFMKMYRIVSEKRRVCGNNTLPYGYID